MTRLIHFSDSHEGAVFPPHPFDKRIFGFCNSAFKRRFQHDDSLLDAAVSHIIESKPDMVIFTGDAVSTAAPEEFRRAGRHFQPLKDSGIPLVCTAGNHDCYVRDGKCREAMLDFYSALTPYFSEKPFLIRTGGLRLAVIPESGPLPVWLSCGRLDDESVELLTAEAEKDDPDPLVIAGHFPVLENSWRRGLRNAETVRKLLKSGGIALSLCGHIHRPGGTLDAHGRGELIAGSVTRCGLISEISYENGVFSLERISLKTDARRLKSEKSNV